MKLFVGLIVGSVLTSVLILGLPANCLIISYINHKSDTQKTPLDSVMVDTIIVGLVLGLYIYLVYFVFWFFSPIQIWINWILSYGFYISGTLFFNSGSVTILLRYFYLIYGIDLLGLSENSIRKLSLLAKFGLTGFSIILDIIGPFQNDNASFVLLGNTDGFEPRVQNGLGMLLSCMLLGISALVTQQQADSMQEETKQKTLVMGIAATCTGIFGIIGLILMAVTDEELVVFAVYHFMMHWTFALVFLFMPALVISQNQRLRDYIENIFWPSNKE